MSDPVLHAKIRSYALMAFTTVGKSDNAHYAQWMMVCNAFSLIDYLIDCETFPFNIGIPNSLCLHWNAFSESMN